MSTTDFRRLEIAHDFTAVLGSQGTPDTVRAPAPQCIGHTQIAGVDVLRDKPNGTVSQLDLNAAGNVDRN